ncbi:hypothetical protein ACJRO7_000659 [Eucalyptus globulus]|uniref:CCHC-type domain-containing protein n=1 Tax=Eucalyptus globulus TaxID=34317 RepID=A0ABD3LY45_EUCGL
MGDEKNNTVMTEVISSSSNRITDKKLAGNANFHQWKKIVKLTLTGRNQHKHLTEFKTRDDVTWDGVDARILGQMLNFMESNIIDMVTHIDTVRELWEYLNLSQEFYRFERKGRSITRCFANFKRLYEELNAVLPISTDVQQMQRQREQLAVMGFLGCLGSDCENVRSQILGGENIASLTDTFARVLRVSRESSQDTTSMVGSSALVSQTRTSSGNESDGGTRGGYSGRGVRGGGRGIGIGRGQGNQHPYGQFHISTDNSGTTRVCHYCGKPGHIQKICYKLHGRLGQHHQFANTASNIDPTPQLSEDKEVGMSGEEYARYTQSQISQPVSSTATLAQ